MDSNERLVEDEINLRDYINVILKYKWLIIAIVLSSTIIAGILSFSKPKVYEVSMAIEPGYIGITGQGKYIYIDSAENIKIKVEQGVFNSRIVNTVGLDDKKAKLKFDVNNTKNSELLLVTLKKVEDETTAGINMLNQLYVELSESYKEIVEFKKNSIDREMSIIFNSIGDYKNDILLQQEKLKILKQKEESLIAKISKVNINTTELYSDRGNVLNREDEKAIVVLVFTSIIQQNISYFNQLNNQLFSLREKEEGITNQIKKIENDIKNLTTKRENLDLSKSYIHSVKLIQEPEVSSNPVAPRKNRWLLLLAWPLLCLPFS